MFLTMSSAVVWQCEAGSPRTTASQLQLSVYVWPTNTVRRGSVPSRPARTVSAGQSTAGHTAPHHTDCH